MNVLCVCCARADRNEAELRARLAAVEAACDEADRLGWHRNAGRKVRAAARGEGDRAAEHHDTEDAHGNPICVCPDLRGEDQ